MILNSFFPFLPFQSTAREAMRKASADATAQAADIIASDLVPTAGEVREEGHVSSGVCET